MAILLKTDGTKTELKPASGKLFNLRELQDAVKGYIELVYLTDGKIMVVNEEGKLNGFEINHNATKLANLPNDVIVGDVLICSNKEIN